MKCAVLSFPGSNGDMDAVYAFSDALGTPAERVFRTETDLSRFDLAVLPGGFSYGDYLRAGAIARFAPVMDALATFAASGRPVLGICNGFQVLCEAGLLPGALLRNAELSYRCQWLHVRTERTDTPWTAGLTHGQVLRLPIAHGEGQYFADADTLRALEENRQIVFRYCAPDGTLAADANPNGSLAHIAGICNAAGNVVGLMPHPERGADALTGGADGVHILRSVLIAGGVTR